MVDVAGGAEGEGPRCEPVGPCVPRGIGLPSPAAGPWPGVTPPRPRPRCPPPALTSCSRGRARPGRGFLGHPRHHRERGPAQAASRPTTVGDARCDAPSGAASRPGHPAPAGRAGPPAPRSPGSSGKRRRTACEGSSSSGSAPPPGPRSSSTSTMKPAAQRRSRPAQRSGQRRRLLRGAAHVAQHGYLGAARSGS